MKKIVLLIVLVAVCAMFAIVIIASKPINDSYVAVKYLEQLGWAVSDLPLGQENIIISLDNTVMTEYYKMQSEYGYDLTKYNDKTVKKYTFYIKNYPSDSKVYANVLMYKGKVIGGDIMTRELNGFMKGLHKNNGTS